MTNNRTIIDLFLNDIEKKFIEVPSHKRKKIMVEMKDHMYSEVENKIANGKDETTAIKETIANFKEDPHPFTELAEQEEYLNQNKYESKRDFGFDLIMVLCIGPLGALTAPILKGYIELAQIIPWIFFFIVAQIIFHRYYSKNMKESRVKTLQFTSKAYLILFALAFGMYAANLTINQQINIVPTMYLLVYIAILIPLYLLFKSVYNKNKDLLNK
ncbi:hypothetical protein [Peribacillus sp. NPDC097225]|uniref:hypothetical protein n=1 Tax=Peribacillus sp. NPDC097225 TaxID=3364400 RepID=UPI00381A97DE